MESKQQFAKLNIPLNFNVDNRTRHSVVSQSRGLVRESGERKLIIKLGLCGFSRELFLDDSYYAEQLRDAPLNERKSRVVKAATRRSRHRLVFFQLLPFVLLRSIASDNDDIRIRAFICHYRRSTHLPICSLRVVSPRR